MYKKELTMQTDKYIMLNDKMYIRVDGEYLPKLYFDLREVADVLRLPYYDTYMLCHRLGIQARANAGKKIRVTLKQLTALSHLKNAV